MREFTSDDIRKTKIQTLKAYKKLFEIVGDSQFTEDLHTDYKAYASKTEKQKEHFDEIAEFYQIVSKALNITDQQAVLNVISSMFRTTVKHVVEKKEYDSEEKAQIIIRNMLKMVGSENERLVTILSRYWVLPMISG